MNSFSDLLDVDTWAQVRKATPKVTETPYDTAVSAIETMDEYSSLMPIHTDLDGKKYWEASLKDLVEISQLDLNPAQFGRALRALGLMLFRKADGYHAAWSDEQIKILGKYLKVGVGNE